MHRNIKLAGLIAATLLASGCNDSTNYDFDKSAADTQSSFAAQTLKDTANTKAIFSPASGIIPSATDLLFTGSLDGTLNIPVKETMSDAQKALVAQLNTLDGFSTLNPVTTTFSSSLDDSSIVLGQSIFVFELATDATGKVTGIAKPLASPADMVVQTIDTNKTTLALIPTAPLKPATRYFAVLTSNIKASDGTPIKADTTYALAKGSTPLSGDFEKLEPLRQATNGLEGLAAAAGIDKEKIVLSWTFTTQSMGKSLQALAAANKASTIAAKSLNMTTKTVLDPKGENPAIKGSADIYAGSITLPYYLNKAADSKDKAILGGAWQVDKTTGLPAKTADVTIPVLITAPNATSGQTEPADGWPVVMFQHGITANRTSLLGIAETLAAAGFVGVAIDMPLHGLDASSPLYAKGIERTFDADLVDNESGAKTADGITDSSGKHFINLESLVTSRDNVRQAVADLMVVHDSLESLDTVIKVDEDKVRFIGHSLGAMVGTTYLAFEDNIGAATLAMPGGGIAQVLRASPTFGPVINAGLAANGLEPGTDAYTAFFGAAQWIIDAADPLNHAAAAAAKHPIHMLEVVGGNSSLPDQVIPNSVPGAPLAGTDPLARAMGLVDTTTSPAPNPAAGLDVLVQFNAGGHSSILKPDPDLTALAVTVEMQTETASFMVSNGAALVIGDSTVIAE